MRYFVRFGMMFIGAALLSGSAGAQAAGGIDTSTAVTLPFSVQGVNVMTMGPNGLSIGYGQLVPPPGVPLAVNGTIMVGYGTACDANTVGNIRYNATVKGLEACNNYGGTYAWAAAVNTSPYPANATATASSYLATYNCYGVSTSCTAKTDGNGRIIVNGLQGPVWMNVYVCGSSNSGHTAGYQMCSAGPKGVTAISGDGGFSTHSFGNWN